MPRWPEENGSKLALFERIFLRVVRPWTASDIQEYDFELPLAFRSTLPRSVSPGYFHQCYSHPEGLLLDLTWKKRARFSETAFQPRPAINLSGRPTVYTKPLKPMWIILWSMLNQRRKSSLIHNPGCPLMSERPRSCCPIVHSFVGIYYRWSLLSECIPSMIIHTFDGFKLTGCNWSVSGSKY